jgi:xanthine dehydrogenase accessory factor
MRNIYLKLAEIEGDLSGIVIATVITTSGSTPAKAGSSALFDKNGLIYGTVGGGVLEGRVTLLAQEYSGKGITRIHNFEFDNDITKKGEAICGGRASVLIDSEPGIHKEIFRDLREMIVSRRSVVIATSASNNVKGSINVKRELFLEGDLSVPDKNKVEDLLLLETIHPPKKLIIAGAGHIGKVLCHLGNLLDFEVNVVDDRPEFANRENFPDAHKIVVGGIGQEMNKMEIGPDTFVVIVTRGHNDDSNALKSCIGSSAAYIGMIGSKTKIEKMKRNFLDNGWATADQWSTLHTPIGLEIGSRTVEEIAVSIAAELVLVRNRKDLPPTPQGGLKG